MANSKGMLLSEDADEHVKLSHVLKHPLKLAEKGAGL